MITAAFRMTSAQRGENRLTDDDRSAIKSRMAGTLRAWREANARPRADGDRSLAIDATSALTLVRLGAHAVGCSTDDLRESELAWIPGRGHPPAHRGCVMGLRSALYRGLRLSNDVRAVRRGRVGRRIGRRIYGKATGRLAPQDLPMTRPTFDHLTDGQIARRFAALHRVQARDATRDRQRRIDELAWERYRRAGRAPTGCCCRQCCSPGLVLR